MVAALRYVNAFWTSSSPCSTIMVACGHAQSAAAQLLSLGDWAIAQPESKLLYHGSFVQKWQGITAECAGALNATLKDSNWNAAASIARKSVRGFRLIMSALRPSFEEHRAVNVGAPTQADIERLAAILNGKLSHNGNRF